jgi:hypothetical protein
VRALPYFYKQNDVMKKIYILFNRSVLKEFLFDKQLNISQHSKNINIGTEVKSTQYH